MRKGLLPVSAGIALATALLLTPFGETVSQSVQSVLVTNFPSIQEIRGQVEIDGPIQLSELRRFENVLVAPVRPEQTTRLVEAGTLDTAGFANVVLSLEGLVKGECKQAGEVGAILIPEEDSILRAFDEAGRVHFALQAAAPGVSDRTPYFASDQPRYSVGFQSYRVYLYNTTDKSVTVNLFAYLTN